MQQMRGISQEIKQLRQELLDFASLIELELDFAEKMLNLQISLLLKPC